MTNTSNIIVVADWTDGCMEPEAYGVMAFAKELQTLAAGNVQVWILGDKVDAYAREIAHQSGFAVTVLHCPALSNYTCEAYRSILSLAIREASPAYVLTAHTSRGWEWAPAVAASNDAGCICGVNGVDSKNGDICFTKDRYGGKVKGRYISRAATTIITVQPGCFKFEVQKNNRPSAKVTRKAVRWRPDNTRFMGISKATCNISNITEANIIVAAGNGIGEEDNLKWIYRLAQILPKAAIAGSRIVCDRGWLSYDRQVGVTGATVSPLLYIACGISGASQHLMGMRGSGFVVAINTDNSAPVFSEADVCIVEDLNRFIPMVLEIYQNTTKRKNGEKPHYYI